MIVIASRETLIKKTLLAIIVCYVAYFIVVLIGDDIDYLVIEAVFFFSSLTAAQALAIVYWTFLRSTLSLYSRASRFLLLGAVVCFIAFLPVLLTLMLGAFGGHIPCIYVCSYVG